MKLRNTLLLAAVGGGLFAYIWFVDRHQSTTQEAAQASSKVLQFEKDKVASLTIRNSSAQPSPIVLKKKDGIWTMEEPLADRADSGSVEQLLSLLDSLKHDSKIDLSPGKETDQLKEFGVAESELSLKATSDSGKDFEILVGKDTAVEGKIYVRQQGKNTVFVVSNNLRTQLTKKTDDFRDHRLSATPTQSVQKVSLKTADGEIELERTGQHWDIRKPLRARATDSKINDLLAGILTATVSQFHPEAPSPEQGLTEPKATFTLQVEGSKEPVTLLVGGAPAGDEHKDKSFAKISSRKAVTVIPNTALDPFLKARPNDLRDRKLARFETDIVDRITIEPAGGKPLVLARKGESWVRKEGEKEVPVKEGLAAKLLSDLQSAETVNFVADNAADPAQYGLDQPGVKVRLSSYASENTAESKAGEKAILTLLFGKVEGDNGYAKLEDEPFIVAAAKTLIESIPTDELALRVPGTPEALSDAKADEITGLEFTEGDLPPLVLSKKDGAWKSDGEKGELATEAVQEVVAKIASLTGEHLASPMELASLEASAAKPALTLKVTSQKEGKDHILVLSIGAALKDGFCPAKAGTKEGIYLISASDREFLGKKLFK